jgi:hypothetical protein
VCSDWTWTRLLVDSLGRRTKACIIATLPRASCAAEETLSTLGCAHRFMHKDAGCDAAACVRGAAVAKDMNTWPTLSEMAGRTVTRECCEGMEKLEEELRVRRVVHS